MGNETGGWETAKFNVHTERGWLTGESIMELKSKPSKVAEEEEAGLLFE